MLSASALGLEPADEIDDVVEAAAGAGADAASRDGDGEVGLAGSGSADQDDVALLSDEVTAGEVGDEGLVGRGAVELEFVEVLGERKLGDGELVFDRARLFVVGLGFEQVADDALRLVLALDGGGHDLVEGSFMP